MTLRAALYARYSSDQQRAASIEDQFRVCRERAEREGWKIAGAYKDSAVSGNSMILRPGIQALLEDARRGVFEILVAEALDRVRRDQADVATLYKHRPVPSWRAPASASASTARALAWLPISMVRTRRRQVQGCGLKGILLAPLAPYWHPVQGHNRNIYPAAIR